jgi:hypothetical protein
MENVCATYCLLDFLPLDIGSLSPSLNSDGETFPRVQVRVYHAQ